VLREKILLSSQTYWTIPLDLYSNSLIQVHSKSVPLKTLFPELVWQSWRFFQPTSLFNICFHLNRYFRYFHDDNIDAIEERRIMDDIALKYNVTRLSDWRFISMSGISHVHYGFFAKYDSCIFDAVCTLYPEYEWDYFWNNCDVVGFWDCILFQRDYLLWLAGELCVRCLIDFALNLDRKRLREWGGHGLLRVSFPRDDIHSILKRNIPEMSWDCFFHFLRDNERKTGSTTFWKDILNRRQFMDWVSNISRISVIDDFFEKGEGHICSFLPVRSLNLLYPEFLISEWKFAQTSDKLVWKNEKVQKQFFDQLLLSFNQSSDIYSIIDNEKSLLAKLNRHESLALKKILENFENSLPLAYFHQYPQTHFWKFKNIPYHVWVDAINQRKCIDWLNIQNTFETPSDWSFSSITHFTHQKVGNLLFTHKNSILDCLKTTYPELSWTIPKSYYKLKSSPQTPSPPFMPPEYWKSSTNTREYFTWLSSELDIPCIQDLISLSREKVLSLGGHGLIHTYDNSLTFAFSVSFPEIQFLFFHSLGGNTILGRMMHALGIQNISDFYRVSLKQIQALFGKNIANAAEMQSTLEYTFPFHNWDGNLLSQKNKRAKQRVICSALTTAFKEKQSGGSQKSHLQVHEDWKVNFSRNKHAEIWEIDAFVPGIAIGVEYQGEQHYNEQVIFPWSWRYGERDEEKRTACDRIGITLLTIPFWIREREAKRFIETSIRSIRPDILKCEQ